MTKILLVLEKTECNKTHVTKHTTHHLTFFSCFRKLFRVLQSIKVIIFKHLVPYYNLVRGSINKDFWLIDCQNKQTFAPSSLNYY